MNSLSYDELLEAHKRTLIRHGGLPGVKNEGFLLSALAQPAMGFAGVEAYPTLPKKAAALGFSLAKNHAFNDGNKRIAFLALALFLYTNGYLLQAAESEVIEIMLALAASVIGREEFEHWIEQHIEPLSPATDSSN